MKTILDKYLNWLIIVNPCNLVFDKHNIYIYKKHISYPITFSKESINSVFIFNFVKINNIKLSNLPVFLFNRENKLKYFIKLKNKIVFINYALLFEEINSNLKSFLISLNVKYKLSLLHPFQSFKVNILKNKEDFSDFIIYIYRQLDEVLRFLLKYIRKFVNNLRENEIFNFAKYFSLAFSILFLHVNNALNKEYFIGEYTKLNFDIFLYLISLYFYPIIILEITNIFLSNYLDIIFQENNNIVKNYIKVILKLLVERLDFLNFYKKMDLFSKIFYEKDVYFI